MGSKGIAECCINPVAPALANAVADATGVRFRDLPLTPDRIYGRLVSQAVAPARPSRAPG
jgi:CO/xanthine dehydrogenase Mo-binding subunit